MPSMLIKIFVAVALILGTRTYFPASFYTITGFTLLFLLSILLFGRKRATHDSSKIATAEAMKHGRTDG
ncbi:hypothetical protein SAMN04488245_1202 [Alloyangia pacifica]|uniref:Uncharacterized protein n=1 Tax=Alloyangia pacifica TaxID=311180 RepID=A0A1I6WE10_9RHOB|nr:hypothetical protein SAMN04488245_1202 [Alloyangia pacifica]SFT24208.1 hypothetical protein SAMN04488050_1192 [Alloyangia pacifica]